MRESFKNIENEFKQDTLIISLWSSTIVHILYLLLYLFLFDIEYNPIVYSLSASLLLHGFFFYWIKKSYFRLVTYVFIFEIEVLLVFLSFFVLGKETGVHYILLIFSMLSFSVNNEKKIKFSNLLFLVNIVLFLGVEMSFIPIKVIVQFPEPVIPYIKTSCILVTLVLIYYLSVYFRKTRIKKEAQLERKQEEIHLQAEQLKELNYKLQSNIEFIVVQNKQLELANSTKNRLFSIISHDLINPLSTLSAFTDLLKESIDIKDQEQLSNFAMGISDSVNSLNVLTQNLLNWSRTQMDSIKPSMQHFGLLNVINNNIHLFQSNLQSKNITLNCKVSDDVIIYADKDMIDAVVRNLLINAIKFSYTNSVIEIYSEKNKESILLHFKDFGVGMSNAQMEKLFVVIDSKSTQGTSNEKGSGLGLVICYEFLKINNCELTVYSQLNKGTTFTIKFPNK